MYFPPYIVFDFVFLYGTLFLMLETIGNHRKTNFVPSTCGDSNHLPPSVHWPVLFRASCRKYREENAFQKCVFEMSKKIVTKE